MADKLKAQIKEVLRVRKRSFHSCCNTHSSGYVCVCVCMCAGTEIPLPPTTKKNERTLFCASQLHTKLISKQTPERQRDSDLDL